MGSSNSVVDDDEEEVDLAGQFPVHGGTSVPGAGARREPTEADVEIQDVPGVT
jgi:hypothetical protein